MTTSVEEHLLRSTSVADPPDTSSTHAHASALLGGSARAGFDHRWRRRPSSADSVVQPAPGREPVTSWTLGPNGEHLLRPPPSPSYVRRAHRDCAPPMPTRQALRQVVQSIPRARARPLAPGALPLGHRNRRRLRARGATSHRHPPGRRAPRRQACRRGARLALGAGAAAARHSAAGGVAARPH